MAVATDETVIDGGAAWRRLALALVVSTIGGVGLWSSVVVLPVIEAEFGLGRAGASLPYTMTLVGFALGGVLMGRLADRAGIHVPLMIGGATLGLGYIAAASATAYWQFLLAQALLIGALGSSASFGPLVADVSLWFRRRRGIAVAIVASGSYLAGAVWPPLIQAGIVAFGWRVTYLGIGAICLATLLPLALLLRTRAPVAAVPPPPPGGPGRIGVSPARLQAILVFSGIACCVAMSMPQVHMVAYCVDLGYGPARGAEMLSVMLGLGVVSRLASGMIADRIGGTGTLLLGASLQALALMLYLPFDGLASLYLIAAVFGLSQGGIVPSYALIVRERFPAAEAGTRVSLVLTSTTLGMAIGGWMTGAIYDLTGSYAVAFLNGIAWNAVPIGVALWLIAGGGRARTAAA